MQDHRFLNLLILFTGIYGVLGIQNAVATAEPDLLAGPGNATYHGIEEQPVTLADGRWEGAPYVEGGASRPVVGLVKDIHFTGDLDADGSNETVVLLWQSAGGTGSNMYIAVMKDEDGHSVNLATALIGDRVKIRRGGIDAGAMTLDVLQAGENDPMCCPTQLARRSWALQEGQLVENEMQVTGTLSLAALEQGSWLLTHTGLDEAVPSEAGVTLEIGDGRVSGNGGCNRYSAEIREGGTPGAISIGPAMTTRMACADKLMEIESRYLASLSRVESFSFHNGSLALNGRTGDGGYFMMLFRATVADTP